MSETASPASGRGSPMDGTPVHDVRGVLAIAPFRKLWLSLSISSFGDWLGLLATTALAAQLGGLESYAKANLAVSGVLILRLLPAIVFGPIAGVVADRFNRKATMVVGDVLRGILFISIPIIGTLSWLFVATVLIEAIGLFWIPAKDASVPNLVPRERLEAANQLSLASTYGSAPIAALTFSGLALLSGVLIRVLPFSVGPNDIAMYLNALSYFWAASVVARLNLGGRRTTAGDGEQQKNFLATMTEGWRFVAATPLIRGVVIGMLGAFGAGGFVIGVAPTFAVDLGAGSPGYGVLFASVFTGLALGMWLGPRVLSQLPRWRLFSLAIIVAGVFLAGVSLVHFIAVAAALTMLVGAAAGVAWVTGYTMIGLEVDDEMRGRTFAFVQSAARIVLVAVMALAPGMAALLGTHEWHPTKNVTVHFDGTALTLLVAAGLACWIGVISYRTMHDRGEVSLWEDLRAAVVPGTIDTWWIAHRRHVGLFLAFEGGDGVGKSTQIQALARRLAELGHDVLVTREPGGTDLGRQLRELVLNRGHVNARAEALLFAADRAQHVAEVIEPALDAGAVVITDRYLDSSVAYQGSGRALEPGDIRALSGFATKELLPDLTILLDLDPAVSADRRQQRGGSDRMEAEGDDFQERVRQMFLSQARRNLRRYLILDAAAPVEELAAKISERVEQMLPQFQPPNAERQGRRSRWAGEPGDTKKAAAASAAGKAASPAAATQLLNADGVTEVLETTHSGGRSPGPERDSGRPDTEGDWHSPWRGR